MARASSTTISDLNRQLHKLIYGMDRVSGFLLQKRFNLTFSQFRILWAIQRHEGLCQADIAKFHELTPAAVSRQIDLLKSRKLIALKKSDNHRDHVFTLTATGKRQTAQAIKLYEQIFNAMFQTLDGAEKASLGRIIGKLSETVHGQLRKHCAMNPQP